MCIIPSICRSRDQVKILSKVESPDLLIVAGRNIQVMTSWPIFHGPLTCYFGHIIMVKIFLRCRILNSRAFGLSALAYVRQSVYQVKIFSRFQDLLMVASWYYTWGCASLRQAGIYKSHDLLTYISRPTDFVCLKTIWWTTVVLEIHGRGIRVLRAHF